MTTWTTKNLDLSAFAGRVVKIRFSGSNHTELDNVKLIPGAAGTLKASAVQPQGNYLEIQPNNDAVSSPFVVPNDASFVNFMYHVGYQSNPVSNDINTLQVAVQPQGLTTWTGIDGNTIKGQTIDGWKRGKLSIQNYRGQTIRLRFGANVTRARIDQISLLTPRGSFSGSQLLAGTTYLNMPMTQFGGTTTPANVTITSLNVYDEYTDLAGTVAYNGQTYTFSLFGNVFNSNLGHPEDKVGNLRDATGNFEVLYYAVRHSPLMPVANPSLTGDNLALYLQRKGTREITFVDVPLAGTLGSALWTSFGAKGRYGAAYTADYWFQNIVQPILISSETIQSQTLDTIRQPFRHKYRIPYCEVVQTFEVVYQLEYDSLVTQGQSGDVEARLFIGEVSTKGYAEYPFPPDYQCTQNSKTSPFQLRDVSLTGVNPGFTINGNSYTEYFTRVTYNRYAANTPPTSLSDWLNEMYVNVGIPLGVAWLTVNVSQYLFPENRKETPALVEVPFTHYDYHYNRIDTNLYRTRILQYNFGKSYLYAPEMFYSARVGVGWWQGPRHTGEVQFLWTGDVWRNCSTYDFYKECYAGTVFQSQSAYVISSQNP